MEAILNNFENKKILVIGDIMLDKYVSGDVKRISPEAPVQVINVKNEKYVPGGSANVCSNLACLDAKTYVSGVIGKDSANKLISCFRKGRINYSLIVKDKNRMTTQKVRVVGRNQQLLRIDYENSEKVEKEIERKMIEKILKKLRGFDAIVVSDYAKGVVTKELFDALMRAAKKENIPVIVDPKPKNKDVYEGAYLIKPNLKEAVEMTGIDIKSDEDIIKTGKMLLKKLKSNILLTCGGKGMYLFEKNGGVEHMPTEAREVYDVTGAGDTVAAVAALCLAAGAKLKEAAFIANKAAGIVVGKAGTSTVSIEEIRKNLDN
jgi:rfaE bifunctional protein kinase chain/domain